MEKILRFYNEWYNTEVTPELLKRAGWTQWLLQYPEANQKRPMFGKQIDFQHEMKVHFTLERHVIYIEYADGETAVRIVKPLPITVGEFNALMEIVKLEQCKITL